MTKPDPVRIYLTVPYAEKDEAKKHGARWDPIVKRWWIDRNDIAKNPGVFRWIADNNALASRAKDAFEFTDGKAAKPVRRSNPKPPASSPRTDFSLPDCVCLTAPWEHCEHTMEPARTGLQTEHADFDRW